MVHVPAECPVTTPPSTLAFPFEADQIPPPTFSASVILAPKQTDAEPVIAPALGRAFMVIGLVAACVPHKFVTE